MTPTVVFPVGVLVPALAANHKTDGFIVRKETWTVGQISGSPDGCGSRRLGPLSGRHMGHGEIRRTVSAGHIRHQCDRLVPDRSAHDSADRAPQPAPQLATVPGSGDSRGIYHVLELRVRGVPGSSRRRALDGYALRDGQRADRLPRGMAGCGAYASPAARREEPC